MSRMLVWSIGWERLNNWAPRQILMSKCANHNQLATLHLEYANCPIFLTTHTQGIAYKLESVQMVDVSIKVVLHSHWEIIHLYQNKHHWQSCKVCIGVATIDKSQNPHMSSSTNAKGHFTHEPRAMLMKLWEPKKKCPRAIPMTPPKSSVVTNPQV